MKVAIVNEAIRCLFVWGLSHFCAIFNDELAISVPIYDCNIKSWLLLISTMDTSLISLMFHDNWTFLDSNHDRRLTKHKEKFNHSLFLPFLFNFNMSYSCLKVIWLNKMKIVIILSSFVNQQMGGRPFFMVEHEINSQICHAKMEKISWTDSKVQFCLIFSSVSLDFSQLLCQEKY